jgi:hypothetical protein
MRDDPHSTVTNSMDEPSPQQAGKIVESPQLRVGLYLLAAILVVIVAYLLWQRIRLGESIGQSKANAEQVGGLAPYPTINPSKDVSAMLLPYTTPSGLDEGIQLRINLKTFIPTRPREDVITYTVELGDKLFAIANKFDLMPETILWGNYTILKDNPEILMPEQTLNILPVDGVYYQWQEGDNIDTVASFFKVKAEDILNYPGNHIDLTTIVNGEAEIESGTWLIIPGGKRVLKDWGLQRSAVQTRMWRVTMAPDHVA